MEVLDYNAEVVRIEASCGHVFETTTDIDEMKIIFEGLKAELHPLSQLLEHVDHKYDVRITHLIDMMNAVIHDGLDSSNETIH